MSTRRCTAPYNQPPRPSMERRPPHHPAQDLPAYGLPPALYVIVPEPMPRMISVAEIEAARKKQEASK